MNITAVTFFVTDNSHHEKHTEVALNRGSQVTLWNSQRTITHDKQMQYCEQTSLSTLSGELGG